jgi:hypothetical protein
LFKGVIQLTTRVRGRNLFDTYRVNSNMIDKSAKINGSRAGSIPGSSNEIDELTKEINEDTTEHERIMRVFDSAMRDFASDRSLETCLSALNASIQMANLRYKLFQSYMHYSRLLEREITRLDRQSQIHQQTG